MRTREDIKYLMERLFRQLNETREAGQKEYAHDENNAFGNFERLQSDLSIDRKQVLWVYLKKHLDGILSFIRGHTSQREDVRGRILDSIVYLILLYGMVEDEHDLYILENSMEREGNRETLTKDAIMMLLEQGYSVEKNKNVR